jgi:hypothetical protein
MESHIKTLGILHVILGSMGLLGAIAILFVFGGLAGLVGSTAPVGDSAIAVPILGGIGGLLAMLLLVFSLPGFIGGIGLLSMAPWSRIFMIVISALHLLHVPIGTALGIYGLWVLTKPETEALLSRRVNQPSWPVAR